MRIERDAIEGGDIQDRCFGEHRKPKVRDEELVFARTPAGNARTALSAPGYPASQHGARLSAEGGGLAGSLSYERMATQGDTERRVRAPDAKQPAWDAL